MKKEIIIASIIALIIISAILVGTALQWQNRGSLKETSNESSEIIEIDLGRLLTLGYHAYSIDSPYGAYRGAYELAPENVKRDRNEFYNVTSKVLRTTGTLYRWIRSDTRYSGYPSVIYFKESGGGPFFSVELAAYIPESLVKGLQIPNPLLYKVRITIEGEVWGLPDPFIGGISNTAYLVFRVNKIVEIKSEKR